MSRQYWAHLFPIVVVLTACGDDSDLRSNQEPSTPPEADDRCLNCGLSPRQTENTRHSPAPRMTLSPQTLMFYGDSSTEEARDLLDVQWLTVTNGTAQPVLIVSVAVLNDLYRVGGEKGAEFFEAGDISGTLLEPFGGTAELAVHFLGSDEQRSAWVQVQTNHPSFQVLGVSVTGKTFTGFDW